MSVEKREPELERLLDLYYSGIQDTRVSWRIKLLALEYKERTGNYFTRSYNQPPSTSQVSL